MPSIEAVDRIKNVVNSLGNEAAILQEKGVSLEDVTPPEETIDADLEDLLSSGPELDEMTTMDSLISSLDEESPEEDDFSLDDLTLTESPDDDLSLLDEPLDLPLDDLPEISGEAGLEDLDSLEAPLDFSEELADLDFSMEEPSEEQEEQADGGEEFPGEPLEDLEELGDLDDLSDLAELEELSLDGEDLSEPLPEESIDLDEDFPDAGTALEDLALGLEEDDTGNDDSLMGEEIVLDEDFGLSEIDDDFLDDMDESDENQFSLDDLGAEYNFSDEGSDLSAELGLDLDELEKNIDQTVGDEAAKNFELTDEELEKLEAALYFLPLNLKIAIQDFFSDETTPVDQLNKMTSMLLSGASVKNLANSYRKYTGKKIEIPLGYEKKSGEDFARERASLITFVKEKVAPRILLGLGSFFAVWFLFITLFNFVYRPLKAESLYTRGMKEIGEDSYAAGEEYFNEAFFGWDIGTFQVRGVPRQDKFFVYADEYIKRRNYLGAEEKYQQLLQAYPANEKGRIAYGRLLSERLVRYRDAEYILKIADPLMLAEASSGDLPYEEIPLEEITEINNVDQLILLGDNYLAWAEEEPDKFEEARYIYATLLKEKRGGNTDEVLLRMFRYHLRRNNGEEIDRLMSVYKDKEKISADPTLQARVFSELAGWLIDNGRPLESRDFILKAEEADKTVPGSHYQYARFFHQTYNREGEKNALTNALGYLDRMPEMDKEHIFMQIDSYRRLGNLTLYVGDYEKAEQQYLTALEIYENSHRLNLIGTSPEIGALYGELGNLNYDHFGDYSKALEYFELAKANMGDTPEISYKEGFIQYNMNKDYPRALLEFYRVSRYYPESRNLLLAMGNSLLKREDYYGAVSQYEQLLSLLKVEESNKKVLLPDEREEEWALIEYLIMTYNNLGVAQEGVSRKTPNRFMENQALNSFTVSSEYFDKLLRNRSTSQRTEISDRAGDNRQLILGGAEGGELSLYDDILPHLDDIPRFYRDKLQE